MAAREQKEVYLAGMTRSGRRGWMGGVLEWQGRQAARRSRPKPGHSGRTGPKERAGEPRLASSQLLYRQNRSPGSPARLLRPPPTPGIWKVALAHWQLHLSPASPFPTSTALGQLLQIVPCKGSPKKCLLFQARQNYSTRPCLQIHKQSFLGQISL